MASGSPEAVKEPLQPLLDIRFEFQPRETVRFRDSTGLMRDETYVRSKKGVHQIRTNDGKEHFVPPDQAFKRSGLHPAETPMYNADWIGAEFRRPDASLKTFLDGAAKLTSHPDFLKLDPEARIRVAMFYTQAHVPWTLAGAAAENAGLTTFNDIVCAGAGVCRHNSVLLATALSEAGFPTRLVSYDHPNEPYGHAWLEVDRVLPDGTRQTYVVDPRNGTFVEPVWRVAQIVQKDPDSFAAKWYLQPGRAYLEPGALSARDWSP